MSPEQRYEYQAEVLGRWVLFVADDPAARDQFFELPGTKTRLEALRAAESECFPERVGLMTPPLDDLGCSGTTRGVS